MLSDKVVLVVDGTAAKDGRAGRAGAGLPKGRLAQVDEIAGVVVFLLSDRSGVITGSVLDWDQNIQGCHD